MYTPTHIYYMNTIECNQKCSKCSHWKKKDTANRLPTKKIIDGLLQIPTTEDFCIVGGEPLLFVDEILEIIDGISKTDIRTVVITNGVLLSENIVNAVADKNIHIVVSIDTLDSEYWKFVRGSNSFELVMKNLNKTIELLPPEKISVQSVLAKETEKHISQIKEFAQKHNIFHSVQDYVSEGFEGYWTEMESPLAFLPSSEQQCYSADRNLSIMQNGDVFTCFQQSWIPNAGNPLGNLNTTSMNQILSSEYASEVSQLMKKCNLPCKVLKCNTKN